MKHWLCGGMCMDIGCVKVVYGYWLCEVSV